MNSYDGSIMSVVYRCPCNDHSYPSKTALKSHRKTKAHVAWQNAEELRALKITLTHKDNHITTLQTQVESLRTLNLQLIERIRIDTQAARACGGGTVPPSDSFHLKNATP